MAEVKGVLEGMFGEEEGRRKWLRAIKLE